MSRSTGNLDSNHAEIANAFRGLGCSFESTASIGRGFPDGVVGIETAGRRLTLLVEIKAFPVGTVKGELNEEQKRWHEAWRGQVAVVRSLEDVGRLVRAAREEAGLTGKVTP